MDYKVSFDVVVAIVAMLGLRELIAYSIRRHFDKGKDVAQARMIEKELESKDIENRLMILDAMEVRINSIIEERTKLKIRVDKLEEELDEYKEKIAHIEEKEAECQKLRLQLEKRLEELVM